MTVPGSEFRSQKICMNVIVSFAPLEKTVITWPVNKVTVVLFRTYHYVFISEILFYSKA